MEKKGSHLDGFEILEIKNIKKAMFNVTEKFSKTVTEKFNNLTEKRGQLKLVIVATVEGKLMVVDGNKYLAMANNQVNLTVFCKNLGNVTKKEYILMRLLLNIHSTRLKYINIAEMIKEISENNVDNKRISNKTGIPIIDVERYSKLTEFDWKDFEKEVVDLQFDPFNTLRE